MDSNGFDRISRLFAERRLSRRQVLAAGGAGVVAAAGAASTTALDATPVPSVDGQEKVQYLFVQSYVSGSMAAADEPGRYTVTLEGGAGQTIYFANRPSRDVGAGPTAQFLDGLGFTEENPPNAALVLEVEPGDVDIAVVELFDPTVDPATNTVTYDVTPLANWDQSLEMGFQEAPTDLADLIPEFGAAHLFIDDCADATVTCGSSERSNPCPDNDVCGRFGPMGYCWNWSLFGCFPCEPYYHENPTESMISDYWKKKCNETFPECTEDGRSSCRPYLPGWS